MMIKEDDKYNNVDDDFKDWVLGMAMKLAFLLSCYCCSFLFFVFYTHS